MARFDAASGTSVSVERTRRVYDLLRSRPWNFSPYGFPDKIPPMTRHRSVSAVDFFGRAQDWLVQ